MNRRDWLLSTAACAAALRVQAAPSPAPLRWPADLGAHPESRTEWWYLTGSLEAGARLWGFQVTFFRSATGLAAGSTSRFAATELVFAHAALTDLEQKRLRHDQRIARAGFGVAGAVVGNTQVQLRDWQLGREEATPGRSRYQASIRSDSAGFRFDLQFDATQPVLVQGVNGLSQKGPQPGQSSRYYSEPQLAVQGMLTLDGKPTAVQGRAWLDHEWSDTLLDPAAVGWDWIGMNLADGSALTAFRVRRADGTSLYAGGSFRAPGQSARNFGADDVRFSPGRVWPSPSSKARYPVEWRVDTPAGVFTVKALLDNQELDSRGSTGAIYWEGLSDLLDANGQRVGRGYLEMTGYAAKLQL
ncbi:MAG: lipocalin-like domain-containing protein [Burkholderiaceae bacterium]